MEGVNVVELNGDQVFSTAYLYDSYFPYDNPASNDDNEEIRQADKNCSKEVENEHQNAVSSDKSELAYQGESEIGSSSNLGLGDGQNLEYSPPSVSPPNTCDFLTLQLQLGPSAVHTFRTIQNENSFSSELQSKAYQLFRQFLEDEESTKLCKAYIIAQLSRYLVDSGMYEADVQTSWELLRSLEREDLFGADGRIGKMCISQFLGIPIGEQQGQIDETNFVEATGEMEMNQAMSYALNHTPNVHEKGMQLQVQVSDFTSTVNQVQNATNFKNASIVDLDEGQPSHSSKHAMTKEQSILHKKLGEKHVLANIYTKMSRIGGSEAGNHSTHIREKKIKVSGRMLVDILFSPKEILEGNVSGKSTPTNKGKQKYDEEKVGTISKLIAWLLTEPQSRTIKAFQDYQEKTQSTGLVGADYNFFQKSALVDYANLQRGKLKKK